MFNHPPLKEFSFPLILLLLLLPYFAIANPKLAVLNIELDDITVLPHTTSELTRTASLKPLLEQALVAIGDYRIIAIDPQAEASANAGFGYLYQHHDSVADLAHRFGAEWVLVGQHYKASFLYSDVVVQLVRSDTQTLVGRYAVQLKGNSQAVTERAMQALAEKIHARIQSTGFK